MRECKNRCFEKMKERVSVEQTVNGHTPHVMGGYDWGSTWFRVKPYDPKTGKHFRRNTRGVHGATWKYCPICGECLKD